MEHYIFDRGLLGDPSPPNAPTLVGAQVEWGSGVAETGGTPEHLTDQVEDLGNHWHLNSVIDFKVKMLCK